MILLDPGIPRRRSSIGPGPFHARPIAAAVGTIGKISLAPAFGLHRPAVVELPQDMGSRLGYRIAVGEAARLAEMVAFDDGWGRDFAPEAGGEAGAIAEEMTRRLGRGIHPECVELAVQDVLERRGPHR